jgi:hypothetical protein
MKAQASYDVHAPKRALKLGINLFPSIWAEGRYPFAENF